MMHRFAVEIRHANSLRLRSMGSSMLQSRGAATTPSLRDIIAGAQSTLAAKTEASKLAAAFKQVKPNPAQGQGGNNKNAQQKQKQGQQPGEKTTPNWGQGIEQKMKFSVDTPTNSKFVTSSPLASMSIRESMRMKEEMNKQKPVLKPAAPGANILATMQDKQLQMPQQRTTFASAEGARAVRPTLMDQVDWEKQNARFEEDAARGMPSGPVVDVPTSERFQRLQRGQEQKRKDFDQRMGLEKDWRTPLDGNGGRSWHRNPKIEEGAVEVHVSKLKREMTQKMKMQQKGFVASPAPTEEVVKKPVAPVVREIVISNAGLTVRELASKLSMRIPELTTRLIDLGVLTAPEKKIGGGKKEAALEQAKVEDTLVDADSAELLILDLGHLAKRIEDKSVARTALITDKPSTHASDEAVVLVPRAPVVCVMGHVDHGKTTLLDTLRKHNTKGATASSSKATTPNEVAGTEAGGITQKLSAFGVEVTPGRNVMFLDTPGHAAFSSMRNHGAIATDLVILVVAIDDGVRPQTIEALKMAKDADCSIIIVLNKIDKIPYSERAAARSRVLSQLLKHDLIAEEFGGDVQVAEVAGRTGEGIDALMESLLLQAEVLELSAAITGQAEAVVLDAQMERGRGVVAEVLVRWGALNVGDAIVVGGSYGKVKALFNDRGESVRTALPSHSVRLVGLRSLPSSGQEMLSVDCENVAREIAERRLLELEARRTREQELIIRRAQMKARMEAAALAAAQGTPGAAPVDVPPMALNPIKINVVIKADGVGTLEALKQIVKGIQSRALQDVVVDVVGASVGDVNVSDIDLAASGGEALVLAFNVGITDGATRSRAKMLDVNICRNDVIYRLEDELVRVMLAHLPKERTLEREGIAKVQNVFKFSGGKSHQVVAGLQVMSGRMRTKASHNSNSGNPGDHNANAGGFVFRVLRNGQPILQESKGDCELKRMKNTVNEVDSGLECGLTLEDFTDYQEGDEIECLKVVWTAPTQVVAPGDSGAVPAGKEKGSYSTGGGAGEK